MPVRCEGGCGIDVMPATANDAVGDRGPWYCPACYEKEAAIRYTETPIPTIEFAPYNWRTRFKAWLIKAWNEPQPGPHDWSASHGQ